MNTERPSFETLAAACGLDFVIPLTAEQYERYAAAAKAEGAAFCDYFKKELTRLINRDFYGFE